MSTKSTIWHEENLHLYEELSESNEIHLEVHNPSTYDIGFVVTSGSIDISMPKDMWLKIAAKIFRESSSQELDMTPDEKRAFEEYMKRFGS